ncbi:hypothetical protein HWN40_06955 [Methanolobus zinderi]|uniref:Uncharacterized protein n=1 Tax=Methanolobus zinderi TaxID=536044 RepID=A0A7D5E7Y9_9EURY|nr:hypothetical protein [Methanolobus zinderi]QLC49998.1 hypothetical protein HWN40_06955 [Methanolobus zinderi]
MTLNKEKTYKRQDELMLFFNGNDIRVHNLEEYFKSRGVFLFSNTRRPLATVVSKFIYGVDSQEKIKRYIGTKAFPTVSGFILEPETSITFEELNRYFNANVLRTFENISDSKLLYVGVKHGVLVGEIEYSTTSSKTYSLFEVVTRNIRFEIINEGNVCIIFTFLEQAIDYSIVYGVINEIINTDSNIRFRIIEENLPVLGNTDKIHAFFKESISKINPLFEVIGITNFSRKKADDGNTKDLFEMNLLSGNLETKITGIDALISSLKNRSARLNGAGFVLHGRENGYLFLLKLISNDDKKRIEIGLNEIKKVPDGSMLESFSKKEDFYKFDSANVSDEEKKRQCPTFAVNSLYLYLFLVFHR